MAWQGWLAAPLLVTLAAATGLWWRARPKPVPPVHRRVRNHQRFLADLDRNASLRTELPQSVLLPQSVVLPLDDCTFGADGEPVSDTRRAPKTSR